MRCQLKIILACALIAALVLIVIIKANAWSPDGEWWELYLRINPEIRLQYSFCNGTVYVNPSGGKPYPIPSSNGWYWRNRAYVWERIPNTPCFGWINMYFGIRTANCWSVCYGIPMLFKFYMHQKGLVRCDYPPYCDDCN